jgi:hypothetical protein
VKGFAPARERREDADDLIPVDEHEIEHACAAAAGAELIVVVPLSRER